MSASNERLVALAVLPPVLAFGGLMITAMALYPGGTWEEPQAAGHSLVRNFVCDLARPVALNGTANPTGAQLAELSLLAFAMALAPFFLSAPLLFPDRKRLGTVVRICGLLASIGGVGIVLVPSHRYGALPHGLMVLLAAGPGLAAALCATLGAWRTRSGLFAAATLAVTGLAVLVFARQLAIGAETTPGLPVLEKTAMILAVGWMLLTVVGVVRRPVSR